MLTEFGKFLRILRISKGDSAKTMSDKLGVSNSYLSAVENGKRNIPQTWEKTLIREYDLDSKTQAELREAITKSSMKMNIDLTNVTDKKKELLYTVIQEDLDEEVFEKLCQVIKANTMK